MAERHIFIGTLSFFTCQIDVSEVFYADHRMFFSFFPKTQNLQILRFAFWGQYSSHAKSFDEKRSPGAC